jgi:stage III sporulation protein AC
MSVEVLFRVAAIGLMAAVLTIVLKSAGREDIALICNLGALVLALVLVLGGVRDLFNTIKALFPLYGG